MMLYIKTVFLKPELDPTISANSYKPVTPFSQKNLESWPASYFVNLQGLVLHRWIHQIYFKM